MIEVNIKINGHLFSSLDEIVDRIERDSDGKYKPIPTDVFKSVWENPKSGRGPLDNFYLENCYNGTHFLIAASDWSDERLQFWHEKTIGLYSIDELKEFLPLSSF